MSDTPNAPTPVQEPSKPHLPAVQEPSPLLPLLNPQDQQLTNLPKEDEYSQAVLIRCLSDADEQLASATGKTWLTVGYMAHIVPVLLQDTGEIVNRARVVLVDPNGKTLAWTSPITTRYWGQIMALKGVGPWEPPLKVRVVSHKGKQAGFWYSLELEIPPKPEVVNGATSKSTKKGS